MLDKLLTDEKTFRIFCLILFAIIFFVILRKNKKEKFGFGRPSSAGDKLNFKDDVEEAFGTNFQAIKNLSDVAAQIASSTTPGELTLNKLLIKDGSTNVNVLQTIKNIQSTNTTQGAAIIAAKGRADAAYTLAGTKQAKGNYLKITSSWKNDKWLQRNVCNSTYPHLRKGWKSSYWCYKTASGSTGNGTGCVVRNAPFNPSDGTFGGGARDFPNC